MFNEEKYKKCIGHLISQKHFVIAMYIIIFALIGGIIGFAISSEFDFDAAALVGAIIGGIIGFILGLSSVWKIEMRIQESYWRIDTLAELKAHNEKHCAKTSAKTETAE